MADRLLEAAPRDEAKIIQAALRSGLFLRDAPSTRAALVRRMEQMEDNARLRMVQEKRRGMEEARQAQDDYERRQSDLLHSGIAPLRTSGHQMNDISFTYRLQAASASGTGGVSPQDSNYKLASLAKLFPSGLGKGAFYRVSEPAPTSPP